MWKICEWRLLPKNPKLSVRNVNAVKIPPVFFRNLKSSLSAPVSCLYDFDGKEDHQTKFHYLFGKSSFVIKTCSIPEICFPHGASPCKARNNVFRSSMLRGIADTERPFFLQWICIRYLSCPFLFVCLIVQSNQYGRHITRPYCVHY